MADSVDLFVVDETPKPKKKKKKRFFKVKVKAVAKFIRV